MTQLALPQGICVIRRSLPGYGGHCHSAFLVVLDRPESWPDSLPLRAQRRRLSHIGRQRADLIAIGLRARHNEVAGWTGWYMFPANRAPGFRWLAGCTYPGLRWLVTRSRISAGYTRPRRGSTLRQRIGTATSGLERRATGPGFSRSCSLCGIAINRPRAFRRAWRLVLDFARHTHDSRSPAA